MQQPKTQEGGRPKPNNKTPSHFRRFGEDSRRNARHRHAKAKSHAPTASPPARVNQEPHGSRLVECASGACLCAAASRAPILRSTIRLVALILSSDLIVSMERLVATIIASPTVNGPPVGDQPHRPGHPCGKGRRSPIEPQNSEVAPSQRRRWIPTAPADVHSRQRASFSSTFARASRRNALNTILCHLKDFFDRHQA